MQQNAKQETLNHLEQSGIAYEIMEHPAVFTMEEMTALGITARGGVVKSLFLRDGKGKNHYLVIVPEEKSINLSALAKLLGAAKLSFGSAERLEKYLGVAQGSVSPLGVLNDEDHEVNVVFDRALQGKKRVGVHPNDNTATIWLSMQDLLKVIKALGNPTSFIDIR